jgi:hypothetical protein
MKETSRTRKFGRVNIESVKPVIHSYVAMFIERHTQLGISIFSSHEPYYPQTGGNFRSSMAHSSEKFSATCILVLLLPEAPDCRLANSTNVGYHLLILPMSHLRRVIVELSIQDSDAVFAGNEEQHDGDIFNISFFKRSCSGCVIRPRQASRDLLHFRQRERE